MTLEAVDATFTIQQARGLLPQLLDRADRIVALRADLADARVALGRGVEPVGGLAQLKSLEAHLQEALDWIGAQGLQVKGIAPLTVDVPSELDGRPVLLCWLEGERVLDWYHPLETGFPGRRRLPQAR